MRRRSALPEHLQTRPFSVASARDAGVGRRRLALDDLERPFHGVRSTDAPLPYQRYAPLLRPRDRFSHTTAAAIWGAPLPADHEPAVHVTAPAEDSRPKSKGVVGHRSSETAAVVRAGVRVSPPVITFLECARVLSLESLVAVGDHLVLDPRVLDPLDLRPHVELAALLHGVRRASGRGIALAREAALLVRPGVESPMETRLRLLLLRAGLPEPVCGYPLSDRRGGHIGWFDLAWPERRVIAEYDGDQHRTSTAQYERDIARFDAAADAGWRVIRVRARGLLNAPSSTVRRVAAALRG